MEEAILKTVIILYIPYLVLSSVDNEYNLGAIHVGFRPILRFKVVRNVTTAILTTTKVRLKHIGPEINLLSKVQSIAIFRV